MKPIISIIIPCFNCSDTLQEALDSCYTQGFEEKEFEIILVDDKSTDNTYQLMERATQEHENVKVFFHEKNGGGGATRNTAISHSTSDVIFCLDSDDVLPANTLKKMHEMLQSKNCDGVGVHHSTKFLGESTKNISRIDTFAYAGEKIPFENILQLDGLCSLYSVFMFTKKAFNEIGGYPTTHGFDTQGFAWRFLSHNKVAYVCPNTNYLHRISHHQSYYDREYKQGRINHNMKAVLLEHSYLFSEKVQSFIQKFDSKNFNKNLFDELTKQRNILTHNYKELLTNIPPHKHDIAPEESNIPRNSMRGIYLRLHNKTSKLISKPSNLIKGLSAHIHARENSDQPLLRIFSFFLLRIKKRLKISYRSECENPPEMIDLVIPTVTKDYLLLNEVVRAAHMNLCHKINKVYLVSKNEKEIIEYCNEKGYVFVDELSVLGYGKNSINYMSDGNDRSGWIFQQLLKLSGDKFTEMENYFVIDSDTILINKHSFIKKGQFVFLENEEWNESYFRSFKKIFGYATKNKLSFTSHMMIFNNKMLGEMKKELDNKNGKPWDEAYLSTINNELSCISDYDTYANWMLCNYPHKVTAEPFYNTSLTRDRFSSVEELRNKYGKRYKSVSFHSYIK
jgi:glycosyltransferase involved in cell wall biosynthesis